MAKGRKITLIVDDKVWQDSDYFNFRNIIDFGYFFVIFSIDVTSQRGKLVWYQGQNDLEMNLQLYTSSVVV